MYVCICEGNATKILYVRYNNNDCSGAKAQQIVLGSKGIIATNKAKKRYHLFMKVKSCVPKSIKKAANASNMHISLLSPSQQFKEDAIIRTHTTNAASNNHLK